jgi:O-antigen/teichoic acid export membrane protein
MQAGKPVIASRVGGIPELIQNWINGYLITHGSIQEGTEAIAQLLAGNGATERLRLGGAGQRIARQKFTLEKMSREYAELYNKPSSLPCQERNGRIRNLLKRYLPQKAQIKQEPLTLRANFSWVLTGNLVYAISRGIILMLLAKLGSPRLVGEFALALAISAPVFIAIDFNLRLIITTTNKEGFCFGPFWGLRLYSVLLGVILIGLIGVVWPNHQGLVIFWVGLAKGFESLSDVLYGIFQKNERMDFIGKSTIWKGLLSVVVIGIIFGITHNLAAGTAGLALVWFLLLIIYDLRNASFFTSLRPTVKFQNLRPLIFTSLPLGLMMILESLNTNIPSYFILGMMGAEALGYYSALLYIIAAADTLTKALGQSATPKLAEYYQAGRKQDFYNTLFKLVVLGVGFGVAGMVICGGGGPQILTLLYQPGYAAYWQVFLLLIIALTIGALNNFCCYAITTAKVYKAQTILSGLTLLINIIFNAILIPAWGLVGSAFALIIAISFRLFGSMVILYLSANNIANLE